MIDRWRDTKWVDDGKLEIGDGQGDNMLIDDI